MDLKAMNAELDRITTEVEQIQQKWEGKRMGDSDEGRAAAKRRDELCKTASALQDEIESEQKAQMMLSRSRQLAAVPEPTLPSSSAPVNTKGGNPRDIAGFVTLGQAVLLSEAFQKYAEGGYPRGHVAICQFPSAIAGKSIAYGAHNEPLVPLTREQIKAVQAVMETKAFQEKAAPTIGSGILSPDRVARIPQVTADQRLRVRDVMLPGQTGNNSVEYVREESYDFAAAPTAHGALKPEAAVEYSLQSAPVRTLPVHMPVQKQQIEDWPQLRSLIDGRLRYDVLRAEEEQVFFGAGGGANLEGLLTVAGTQDIASNGRYSGGSHTLIDVVRMGITDVMVAGYVANAVALHPYDWETILLEKGSDDRYVWAVVTTENGARIWGLQAVESVGLASRAQVGRRELLVGDFQQGAQLIDRMDLTIQVGLVDDQFIRNMLTILCEERIALPIYAPAAFAHFETAEEES